LKTSLPSRFKVGFSRIGYELKTYVRTPDALFFNFFFPIVLFVIFTLAFSDFTVSAAGIDEVITSADIYLPAMLAMGVFISGTQNLGIDIAIEKHDGTLRRLAGSPISPVSYFIGKFGQVFVSGTLQALCMILMAHFVFGASLPGDTGTWLTLISIFYLGLIATSILGVAVSALPRSAKSATSVILPPILILQFISGVFLSFSQLPEFLQNFASVFPVKWIAQGFRSVFYPDALKVAEMGGEWNLDQIALVLGAWAIVGLFVTLLTFRWVRKS